MNASNFNSNSIINIFFYYYFADCDVNCHKKCEKLAANLCGVNQKLIVEALATVRRENQGAIIGTWYVKFNIEKLEFAIASHFAQVIFKRLKFNLMWWGRCAGYLNIFELGPLNNIIVIIKKMQRPLSHRNFVNFLTSKDALQPSSRHDN